MLNPKKLEEIAKQIADSLPAGVKNLAEDIETKTKEVLQRKLTSMDFVSREEFDIQTQVLQRTREKLTQLEQKVETYMAEQGGIQNSESDKD
jgi:BMFP domain-containing protein YqiC